MTRTNTELRGLTLAAVATDLREAERHSDWAGIKRVLGELEGALQDPGRFDLWTLLGTVTSKGPGKTANLDHIVEFGQRKQGEQFGEDLDQLAQTLLDRFDADEIMGCTEHYDLPNFDTRIAEIASASPYAFSPDHHLIALEHGQIVDEPFECGEVDGSQLDNGNYSQIAFEIVKSEIETRIKDLYEELRAGIESEREDEDFED